MATTLIYAPQATKTLQKATPLVDTNNDVQQWNIVVQYALNGYTSSFNQQIKAGANTFAAAPLTDFTQAQLLGLFDSTMPDQVFESQYINTKVNPPAPRPTPVPNFDINTLK